MSSKALERLRELDRREREAAKQTPPNTPPPTAEGGKSLSIRTASTDEAAELETMQDAFDLLGMIRADTGESGHASGDYIEFHHCPICHHRDDFRYYPATNSACCYGGSNPNANADGRDGGRALWYLRRTGKATSDTEAVKLLREQTGHPYEGKPDRGEALSWATEESKPDDEGESLPESPPWRHVNAVDPRPLPPDLIHEVLRRGQAGLLVSKAKSGKSYAGVELAVAVATGGTWMGYRCEQGRTLYIDPEMDESEFDHRCKRVARAVGADAREVSERVECWHLDGVLVNGKPPTIEHVSKTIAKLAPVGAFDLIIFDSASFLVSGDENASIDIRTFFTYAGRARRATGAAALVIHHEGLAKSGDRDAIARARGSSAWGDCPSSPLALTEIFPPSGEPSDYLEEGERAFVLEDSGMRSHAGVGGRHVIWHWPLHVLDTTGVTEGWKPKTSQGDGGKQAAKLNKLKSELRASQCVSILLSHMLANGIGADGMAAGDAAGVVGEAMGATVKPTTIKTYVAASDLLDVWQKSANRWRVVPRHLPHAPEQEQADISI